MESKLSNNFRKSFRKLHPRIQEKAAEKISIFEQNPFDLRLDTHKLHGEDKEIWAFSVTKSYRIKFVFTDEQTALFLEIGTHDIYK
ncbi:MAG: type II toxin-antitoxin system mRNA interferase toxin, RelE/StbE family [bacterium]|nr:type II toxin-antitoxin system mRNA interferase toxin, RelE/StbE family [bacterium]